MASERMDKLVLLSILLIMLSYSFASGFPAVPKPDFETASSTSTSSNNLTGTDSSIQNTGVEPASAGLTAGSASQQITSPDVDSGAISNSISEVSGKIDSQSQKIDGLAEEMQAIKLKQEEMASTSGLLVIGVLSTAVLAIITLIIVLAVRSSKATSIVSKPAASPIAPAQHEYTYPNVASKYLESAPLSRSAASPPPVQNTDYYQYSQQIYNYYSTHLARGYNSEVVIEQLVRSGYPRGLVMEIIGKHKNQGVAKR